MCRVTIPVCRRERLAYINWRLDWRGDINPKENLSMFYCISNTLLLWKKIILKLLKIMIHSSFYNFSYPYKKIKKKKQKAAEKHCFVPAFFL